MDQGAGRTAWLTGKGDLPEEPSCSTSGGAPGAGHEGLQEHQDTGGECGWSVMYREHFCHERGWAEARSHWYGHVRDSGFDASQREEPPLTLRQEPHLSSSCTFCTPLRLPRSSPS